MLRSWALPKGLPTASARNRLAIAVPDHDLDHLTDEDASKSIADSGWWELEDRDERRTVFVLHGRTGSRRYALVRTRGAGDRLPGAGGLLLHLTSQQPAG